MDHLDPQDRPEFDTDLDSVLTQNLKSRGLSDAQISGYKTLLDPKTGDFLEDVELPMGLPFVDVWIDQAQNKVRFVQEKKGSAVISGKSQDLYLLVDQDGGSLELVPLSRIFPLYPGPTIGHLIEMRDELFA